MIHDSSTVMLGHYFKKRREFVEIFFCAATGIGIALTSLATSTLLRSRNYEEAFSDTIIS
jgi:hypothetical protein